MKFLHRSNPKIIVAIAAVATAMAGVLFFLLSGVRVVAAPAIRGKGIEAVYATGTVEAESRIVLRAKANGTIAELLVREGDTVAKGALLARIDAPDVTAELKRGDAVRRAASSAAGDDSPQIASLQSQAASIRAELSQARSERGRLQALAARGAIAQIELDRVSARVRSLQATLSGVLAQQRAMRVDLDATATGAAAQVEALASHVANTEIRAPFDGVVLTRSIELGEDVTMNQPLFKVGASTLIIEAMVDEADVGRIRPMKRKPRGADLVVRNAEQALVDPDEGRPSLAAVRLYAFPQKTFQGKVSEVLADADRDRKTFHVKVELDAPPPGLRSGMSAEMNIISRQNDDAILVPRQAERDGAIWVVEGGKARRRDVKLGLRDLLKFEILDGVKAGELVVLEGQEQLEDGARVRVSTPPPGRRAPGKAN